MWFWFIYTLFFFSCLQSLFTLVVVVVVILRKNTSIVTISIGDVTSAQASQLLVLGSVPLGDGDSTLIVNVRVAVVLHVDVLVDDGIGRAQYMYPELRRAETTPVILARRAHLKVLRRLNQREREDIPLHGHVDARIPQVDEDDRPRGAGHQQETNED